MHVFARIVRLSYHQTRPSLTANLASSISLAVLQALLFRIDKSSLGVSRIGVATPRDDCPYTKK